MPSYKYDQKQYAKLLFTKENLSQKEIADRVNVTEKTVSRWANANDGEWKKLKRSMLTTKQTQLTNLYKQLEELQNYISTRPTIYDVPLSLLKEVKEVGSDGSVTYRKQEYNEEEFPIKQSNMPTSKEADIISKLTASIQRLESDTSLGEAIDTGMQFINFLQMHDYNLSKNVTTYFDIFINEKLRANG